MANKPARGKQSGITPGKLILIGVLSVVLLGVIYAQFGASNASAPEIATASRAPRRPAAATELPAEDKKEQPLAMLTTSTKTDYSSDWQVANLATATSYDPFALPASFPQRLKAGEEAKVAQAAVDTQDAKADAAAQADAIKAMQTEFLQLQHKGVRVVMQEHDKFVALVGERTIHVGDEIDGFTVVAIDAEGVRVARDVKQ